MTIIRYDISTTGVKAGRGEHVVNVYKALAVSCLADVLSTYPHLSVYTGDFNSHHGNWRYIVNDNSEVLVDSAKEHGLHLVFDAKDRGTFRSVVWNRVKSLFNIHFI